MTIPVCVTPADPLVSTEDLRKHLRVESTEQDGLIASLGKSAEAAISRSAGRLLQQQEWQITYGEAGEFRLPFYDVTEVAVVDADGDPVAATLAQHPLGCFVTIVAPAVVTMTVKPPEDITSIAVAAVKLLVGHWFENRESVVTGTIATALPMTVADLTDLIRVVQV